MPIIQELLGVPSTGGLIGKALGEGIGGGFSAGLQQSLSDFQKQKQMKASEDELIARGYSPQLAKLYTSATVGGQTEILKTVLDELQREGAGISQTGPQEEVDIDIGLTPKEKAKREEGRFSKQFDKFNELSDKSSVLSQEKLRIDRLKELNKEGNLPKGLGRINVDLKSGELIVPFGASEESQEFIKIVNDFLSGAKDTFGARVTNFEVNRFLRRLPSLLNTEEGRERVLRQMEILNEINQLHTNSVLSEIEKKGGIRKIDLDVATRNARKSIEPKLKELQKEYVVGKKEREASRILTKEIAQQLLDEVGGDVPKARELAKKRGYEF